jgi:hypothetical protein
VLGLIHNYLYTKIKHSDFTRLNRYHSYTCPSTLTPLGERSRRLSHEKPSLATAGLALEERCLAWVRIQPWQYFEFFSGGTKLQREQKMDRGAASSGESSSDESSRSDITPKCDIRSTIFWCKSRIGIEVAGCTVGSKNKRSNIND